MARVKDVIIKRKDGLYAMRACSGKLGFTNKINATHFTGKSVAKKIFPTWQSHNVRYIDLTRKSDI